MSDLMLYGVLRMPYDMAMGDELSRRQFYSRVQEAADRLEKAEAELNRRTPTAPEAGQTARYAGSVMTWQERMSDHYAGDGSKQAHGTGYFKDQEIADLRAQLALAGQCGARQEPVAYMIRDKREAARFLLDGAKWKPCSVEDYELRKVHADIFEFRPLVDAAPVSAQGAQQSDEKRMELDAQPALDAREGKS